MDNSLKIESLQQGGAMYCAPNFSRRRSSREVHVSARMNRIYKMGLRAIAFKRTALFLL